MKFAAPRSTLLAVAMEDYEERWSSVAQILDYIPGYLWPLNAPPLARTQVASYICLRAASKDCHALCGKIVGSALTQFHLKSRAARRCSEHEGVRLQGGAGHPRIQVHNTHRNILNI